MAGSSYRDLVVRIVGDAKGMTAATKQAETGLAGFEKKLGAVQSALASAFAGGMVVKFAKDSMQAALEDSRAQERLAKTLQNVVKASDEQVAAVERSIKTMETQFAVADDELRPAFETLVRATKDVGQAQSLMQLALDVSAGSGKGLQEVTVALVKAMGGQMRGLKDLGINVKTAAGDTASFADVQQQLVDMFSGQAAAAADSQTGRLRALGIQYENLKESVGTALLPVLMQLAGIANSLFGWFNHLGEGTQHLIAQIVVFGTIGVTAVKAFQAIRLAVIGLGESVSMSLPELTLIAGTILGIVEVAKMLWGHEDRVKRSTEEVARAMSDLGLATSDTARVMDAFHQVALNAAMTGDQYKTVEAVVNHLGLSAEATAKIMSNLMGGKLAQDGMDKFGDTAVNAATQLQVLIDAAYDVQPAIVNTNKALFDGSGATDKATSATEQYNAGLQEQIRYQKIAEEKIRATTEAVLNGADAVRAKFDTKFAADKAVVEYRAGLKSLQENLKGLKRGTDEYNVVIEDQAVRAFDAADGLAKQAVAVSGLTDKNQIAALRNQTMVNSLLDMASTLEPGSPLRKMLEAYIAQLGQIPGTIVTDLSLNSSVTGLTASQISDIALHRNDGRKKPRSARAAGGPVSAGSTYLVGELGPELLTMGASAGMVTPNKALRDGGNSYHINVSAPQGQDPYTWGQAIVKAIKAFERTNGAVFRAA